MKLTLAGFAIFLLATNAYPQAGRAELFGVVRDASGLAVASSEVEARQEGTNATFNTATVVDGVYHLFALPPGSYEVNVARQGFRTVKRTGIQLRVADRISLDLILEVGDAAESVEVRAAAPLLQANTGTVSATVERRQVVNLPLDGRNFVSLIALAPGVALPVGSTLPRINGSRPRTSEYIYDGISVLQPEPGQVAYFPIIDAIDEFRVNINSYSAEYGRSNGGVIQVNQKSGTNEYHGTVFEFFRNEKLNARNLFAPAGPKPVFRRNQFGLVLGGPVQHNRTFFFVDYQGTELQTGVPRISTVPTTAQRRGFFSTPLYDPATTRQVGASYLRDPFPDHTIPLSRIDPAALAVAARYPAPNVFLNGNEAIANNYRRVGTDRTEQHQFDGRLDRYFGTKHRIFGRYAYLRDDSSPTTPLPDGSGNINSGVIGNTLTRADSVAAEHAWTLSPASVNQFRFGFTRRGFTRDALPGLPVYQITGLEQIGPPLSANSRFTTSVTQLIENYSAIRGQHSLKAGADVRLERLDVFQPPSPSGTYQFTNVFTGGLTGGGVPVANTGYSFASFLLGQVQSFNIDSQQSVLKPRAKVAEFFLQDDWRASRRLSVNLGMRYTLNFPSTEANDHAAVFNLATQKLDFAGAAGNPRNARNLEKGDFGPRVGLAYKVTDSFVVRSGYGLVWIEQAGITTPFTTPLFPFIQSASVRSPDNINPAFVLSQGAAVQIAAPNPDSGLGQGVFGTDRKNGSGYAQQWNFTLQKTLGENWSVEAGYLGSKITRLGGPDTNLNQLPVERLALGSALTQQVANPFYRQIPVTSSIGGLTVARQQLLRPYPRFTTVTLYRNNVGNSTYHSLQARVEKRFARGLTFSGSYTHSKLIDDASSVFDAAILTGPVANFPVADSFNRRLEKDLSNGDIPHVFSSGFVYELGRGWRVAGIMRMQSGMPVAVLQATNLNAFAGFGTQRPNRVRDPALADSERSTERYFDTGAFTQAGQFTVGNSSRNPVRGPGYRDLDLMVGRLIRKWNAEVRVEVFNVTNTPALGNPNGNFGTAAFGTISATAADPRVVEVVVKIGLGRTD